VKKFAKWAGIMLASIFLVFLILAIVIPLVVDVDKYRPKIVEVANERLNGKLELGRLSLSLWGQVRVDVAGLKLLDTKGRPLIGVQEAFFHVPFSSVLKGAPVVTLKMRAPEVNLIKDKAGRLNAFAVVKESGPKPVPAPGASPGVQAETEPKSEITLPAIAARARLGLELLQAKMTYTDHETGLNTELSDLNVVLRDVSLSRSTQLEIWANLDTRMGEKISVKGPVRLTGAANPHVTEGRLEKLAAALKLDADGLEILAPGLFTKNAGIPAQVDISVAASEKDIRFERFNAKFHNAELTSSGVISGMLSEGGAPSARFELSSNAIELKPWQELVPLLREYDPSGRIQLQGKASGPVNQLSYEGKIEIVDVSAKTPRLKTRPVFKGQIRILTDRLEQILLSMKAPGNDVEIRGKLVSFTRPQADLVFSSSGMDLDQLIELPPLKSEAGSTQAKPVAKETAGKPPASSGKSGPAADSAADYDALLAPLHEMPIARVFGAKAQVNLKSVKVYDVRMTEIAGALTLNQLNLALSRFSMKLWKGSVTGDAAADLGKKVPTYRFSSQVSKLDLADAVASQLQLFKNTIIGKADFQMSGQGASFNPEPAMQNLNARGKMSVEGAAFATIDVAKMISEALNQAIQRVSEKVPQLKGKTIQSLPNRESRYELISSDMMIADGKFSAPNFVAKAAPKKGIDLNGSTIIGMLDRSISADWTLIDTYNLTRAADVSVTVAGVQVERVLTEKGKPLRIPVHVGCSVSAPCYSYTQVPEHLAKVALANLAAATEGRAKQELLKKAAPLLDKAPPAVQKGLDEIRKKLFR